MSQYIFLKQADGSFLKLLADDDGVIQYTTNQADYADIVAGSADAVTSLTGAVTGTGPGATATTLAANVVANANMATMATHTFKGNITAGTAVPTDITRTQLTAELNLTTGSLKGLQSPESLASDFKTGTALTDASVTVQSFTDGVSMYVLPSGTLSVNRNLTLGNTSIQNGYYLRIVCQGVAAHDYVIKDHAASTLVTWSTGSPATCFQFYSNAGAWTANTVWLVN